MEPSLRFTTSFPRQCLVGRRYRPLYSLLPFRCMLRLCSCSSFQAVLHQKIPSWKLSLPSPWEGTSFRLVDSISSWNQLPSSSKASEFGILEYLNKFNLVPSFGSLLTIFPKMRSASLRASQQTYPWLGNRWSKQLASWGSTGFPGLSLLRTNRIKLPLREGYHLKDRQELQGCIPGTCGSISSTTLRNKVITVSASPSTALPWSQLRRHLPKWGNCHAPNSFEQLGRCTQLTPRGTCAYIWFVHSQSMQFEGPTSLRNFYRRDMLVLATCARLSQRFGGINIQAFDMKCELPCTDLHQQHATFCWMISNHVVCPEVINIAPFGQEVCRVSLTKRSHFTVVTSSRYGSCQSGHPTYQPAISLAQRTSTVMVWQSLIGAAQEKSHSTSWQLMGSSMILLSPPLTRSPSTQSVEEPKISGAHMR